MIPDDKRVQRNVMIPADGRADARSGQLVVAEITTPADAHRPPIGKILAVLGDKLTASQAVEAAIHAHSIPHEFPPEVIAQATAVPLLVQPADIAGRVDLRNMPLVTIDGEDAKDFDDAVWCEPNKDGFRLIVAIADVSHYVRPARHWTTKAQLRATSVYSPASWLRCVPETLSNGIAIDADGGSPVFVCDMQVGRDGIVTGAGVLRSGDPSHARPPTSDVWNRWARAFPRTNTMPRWPDRRIAAQIRQLHQLTGLMDKARQKARCVEFESSEVRFVLEAQGAAARPACSSATTRTN